MEITFPKNQLNDLIINKLKKIMQLQNNVKIRPSRNVQQKEENVTFCFLRYLNKVNLPLENAEEEQTQLANWLKNMGKGKTAVEKKPYLKKSGLLFSVKEKNS